MNAPGLDGEDRLEIEDLKQVKIDKKGARAVVKKAICPDLQISILERIGGADWNENATGTI